MVADANVQQLLDAIPEKLGIEFVPKIFLGLQDRPDLLMPIWQLIESTLVNGRLHRLHREMIFIVTSEVKHCSYCSIAHRAIGRSLGLSQRLIDIIDSDIRSIEPESLRTLLLYAQSLASNLPEKALKLQKSMLEQGYVKEDIEEVVAAVGVASLASTMANGMSLNEEIDPEFLAIINAA